MSDAGSRLLTASALVLGSLLGMGGTFAPSVAVRGIAWALDGTLLIVGAALLVVHYLRRGDGVVAAGFLVYVAGQALVLATSAMDLRAGIPIFGAGTALWSAALVLVSLPGVAPLLVRILGLIAALLFAVVALEISAGNALTALTQPLPFFAYPFLVATLIGWAWIHYRGRDER